MTSEERKAAIVAAAVRLFSERGFRGTTTRDLAAAVGVTEPVLYEHFKSKRHLYRSMIETKSREGMERAASQLAPYIERADDRAFFLKLAELLMQRYTEEPAYFRLLLYLALESDELADLFYNRHTLETHKMIASYIRKRIRQKAFRRVDPRLAARAFLGMVVYHSMLRLFFQDRFVKGSRKKVIEAMVTIFLAGIRNPGGAQ